MKKRKGFTLVELMIAAGFLAIILMLSTTMYVVGAKTHQFGEQEFTLQSGVRLSSEVVVQTVRYANVIFTIPKDYFKVSATWDSAAKTWDYDTSKLSEEWSYFGIVTVTMPSGNDASAIVNFVWNSTLNDWDTKVILDPVEGFTYEFLFSKTTNILDDTVLGFNIKGTMNGTTTEYITVDSQVDALNALQIMTRGVETGEEMVAIAYREDGGNSNDLEVDVALVMDTSSALSGASGALFSGSVLGEIKKSATSFLDIVKDVDNMNVLLVPFADSANGNVNTPLYTRDLTFKKVSDPTEYNKIYKDINGGVPPFNMTGLATGGNTTNTGDGMRVAYHKLKSHNNATKLFKNYVVVFAYAGPTSYTSKLYTSSDPNYNEHQFLLYDANGVDYKFDYKDFYEGDKGIYPYTSVSYAEHFYMGGFASFDPNYIYNPPYPANPPEQAFLEPTGDYSAYGYGENDGNSVRFGSTSVAIPAAQQEGISNNRQYYTVLNPVPPYTDRADVIENLKWEYIELWTDELKALKDKNNDPNTDIFYISIEPAANPAVAKTADSLGIDTADSTHYINATDSVTMKAAFETIATSITDDYWKLIGPELKE